MPAIVVGVDPSREIFEFQIQGEQFALLNVPESFPRLLDQLRTLKRPVHVLCKRAGGCEAGIIATLQQDKIPVYLVATHELCKFGAISDPEEIDVSLLVQYGEANRSELQEAPRSTYIPPVSKTNAPIQKYFFARLLTWLTGTTRAKSSLPKLR